MPSPGKGRFMLLRYQMNDVIPLLPIPQPPWGKTAYNIPCPICDTPDSRDRHLNINLKKNVFRCPKCGQFSGGVFDLYAYYKGISCNDVLKLLCTGVEEPWLCRQLIEFADLFHSGIELVLGNSVERLL